MAKSPLPFRALLAVLFLAPACSGGDDGGSPTGPVATIMQKTGGDDQTGLPGTALTLPLEVRITDAIGAAIPNYAVTFATTAGTLNPTSTTTDAAGRARTVLTLPTQSATVTVTAAAQGLSSVSFTARSAPPALNVTTVFLGAARVNVPYVRRITASGGTPGGTFSYSVTSGSLPAGLTLESDGRITGTATTEGSFPVSVRVSDGRGSETTQNYTLNVCAAPQPMAINEVRTLQPSTRGSCGIFLPSGTATGIQGARYRVTVARPENAENGADIAAVSVVVSGNGVTETPVTAAAQSPLQPGELVTIPGLARDARLLAQNSREHERMLQEGENLARTLGTEGLLRPRSPLLRAPELAPLADKIRHDVSTPATCGTAGAPITAIKLAENDWLALYQDSTQNAAAATQVTPEQGAKLIELTTTYGKPIIDRYFGGVADIDGNGKVIIIVTPKMTQALGMVWTGNFYRKADCAASNEGEYLYIIVDAARNILNAGPQYGQHVVIHELKHVSSLYQRLLRAGGGTLNPRQIVDYNPLWMEEGAADIAAEMAARYAWAQLGGPAMNVQAVEEHFRRELASCRVSADNRAPVCTENYSVLVSLLSAQEALSFQPNSVVAQPAGAPTGYVYSSGWLFNRWLGDAYGNATAGAFGDADFFKRLNDQTSASGIAGVEGVTGKSWAQLMDEFSLAATAHGWGGITVPRAFTTYDFITAIEMWCFAIDPVDLPQNPQCGTQAGPPGAFPWPVTTDSRGVAESKSFLDSITEGGAGPSGMRVHEFLSNGTGQGAEINVEAPANARIFVIRLR